MARILIVDDEKEVVDLLRRLLAAHGHEADVATGGLAALSHLASHACDLLITDLVMPDMDGLALIASALVRQPALPVIAITGGDRDRDGEPFARARAAGAVVCLGKPFTGRALVAAIAAVLPPRAG